MISAALTGKVKLGVFLPLSLFNGTFDRKRKFDADTLHVRLDLVKMLLTKVLDRISHGEWFKY